MKLYIEFEIDDDRIGNTVQAESMITKRLQEVLLRMGPNDLKIMDEQSLGGVVVSKADWIWMPHPGHLCVSADCQFRMATYVNGYIVSTIGEYRPAYKNERLQEIGLDRLYETMVFRAERVTDPDVQCCAYEAIGEELDFASYNDAGAAYRGHLELCEKWDKR